MSDPTRMILQPAPDGRRWRLRPENEDVEGHSPRARFSLELDGEDEQGEPLFRMQADGQDVEPHRRHSSR